jgi:hypothetical protein
VSNDRKKPTPGLTAPRFKPGQSGNPGGKPVGARNRITALFLNTLAADFEEHGAKAIQECREHDPGTYVKVVASLLPKEVDLGINRLEEMSTSDIIAAVSALSGYLAASEAADGTESPPTSAH